MIEYTVALIKNPSVGRGDDRKILQRITDAGFHIVKYALLDVCPTTARVFYSAHYGKPYYPDLESTIVEKPVIGLILVHPKGDTIKRWRALMGATKSSTAESGTIRAEFGGHRYLGDAAKLADNAVHGSDSPSAAALESAALFKDSPFEDHSVDWATK